VHDCLEMWLPILTDCFDCSGTKSRRKRNATRIKGPKVGFGDLGLLVYGGKADETEPTSPTLENSFEKGFDVESNKKSWKKIGAVPLTRNCMNSPLVRHEITTTNGQVDNSLDPMSERYAEIERTHNRFIDILNEAGYLGSIFETQIRRKARETLQEPLADKVLTLTEPISPKKLAWLAEAKSVGQQFQKYGGNGHLNPDVSFLTEEHRRWQKDIQELEQQKKTAGDLQKLLREAEEVEDQMERSMIDAKPKNRRLTKDMLASLIAGKLGRKPKSELAKPALEKIWFHDGLKDKPAQNFRVWTEEDERRLQKKKEGPKEVKDTLLGRTRDRNIIRFVDAIKNVDMEECQIDSLIQQLETAKLAVASKPAETVTVDSTTIVEMDCD
jgi:hypothetical protein